ncbi:gamma-aminobutyric acid receptor subunit beta-1-like isoform X3 [Mytilus trossulus]|uniref:gamma-aminobutyric acid receptor subunit beta-1-like isoform X3 n=1 Tax=Mytilus trossulus TaxID=6551 RepID=UPI003007A42A
MAEIVNGESKSIKPKPKKSVFIKVTFLKISNIETVKEQFSADVFIKARWREPSLDHSKVSDNLKLDQYWSPKLVVQNVLGSPKQSSWKELNFGKGGEAFIVEKRRIKGTFAEMLELRMFPFDFQDISVVLTSEHPIQELEILEDEQELSSMNVSCFVDVQEWELKDYVVTEAKQMTKEFSETKNISFPLLTVKTLAVRQFGFFVWNILIIMTIISLLSFTTFAVDNTKPQNRLQLGFTLTLTGVTFRFVTNQSLPKISYLTKLDIYILFCMIFNFCISIWHAVITRFKDNSNQDSMDFWAFIIFIIIYSVFQLIYFMIVVGSYFWRRRKVQQLEKEYQEKAIKLIGESWKSNRKITSRSKVRDGRASLFFG